MPRRIRESKRDVARIDRPLKNPNGGSPVTVGAIGYGYDRLGDQVS
jgi:hypothetical protein